MKSYRIKVFGIYLSCRLYDLIYTDGWKTGFTVKSMLVTLIGKNMYTLHIPLFPMSYNRTTGLYVREAQKQIRKTVDEKGDVWM